MIVFAVSCDEMLNLSDDDNHKEFKDFYCILSASWPYYAGIVAYYKESVLANTFTLNTCEGDKFEPFPSCRISTNVGI